MGKMYVMLIIIIILIIVVVIEGIFIQFIIREYKKLILKAELLTGIIEEDFQNNDSHI